MDGPTTEQRDALIAQYCGIAAGASHTEVESFLYSLRLGSAATNLTT